MRQPLYERTVPEPDQSWRWFEATGLYTYLWHNHAELELILITDGTGSIFVGDRVLPYAAGDLFLLGAQLPHAYVSATPSRALVCQFPETLIGPELRYRPEFTALRRLLGEAGTGLHYPECAEQDWLGLAASTPGRRTVNLLGMLVDLAERPDGRRVASSRYLPDRSTRSRDRLDRIVAHLTDHLLRPITLAEIAEVAALTPTATSRFFRRQTGMTITAYVNRARIANACHALAESDAPIATVARLSGFANLAHFNREFRRSLGQTPSSFRRIARPPSH
jgi:AraC-like DNA-binding protein